jgi:colicin import membrane protein
MATTMVEVLVQADHADPFRHGWRPVRRVDAAGVETWERLPLSLEDVLHPEEGDQVTRAEPHERRCLYLYDVFQAQVMRDPGAVVLHDVRIAWDVPGLKPHGPDLMVISGVGARRAWGTFDVAAEGVRPDLIVEVTSPETASIDRSNKLEEYEAARVDQYIIIDAVQGNRWVEPRLLGYHLVGGRYRQLAPDARGRLWLPAVAVWIGVEEGEIVCRDESGQAFASYAAERQARADAEARIARLEAEVRRLRGGA